MCLTNNYNIIMEQINFEWDENKNIINQKKHNATKKETTQYYQELFIEGEDAMKKEYDFSNAKKNPYEKK